MSDAGVNLSAENPWRVMALNNAWANEVLLEAISGLSDEAFAAPRPGFFPSLKATLNHILLVDLFYLDAMQEGGLGYSLRDRPEVSSVPALAQEQAAADLRLIGFCEGLTGDDLGRTITMERPGGPVQETIAALLLHLFQHQVHHRGQAHTMILAAGIAPPQLDDFHLDYGRVPSAQAWWDRAWGTGAAEARQGEERR
ncbi:nuclease [Sagittula sp. P11]|uniref:DinB family protein n=1 Tax=Sagittula sp. P11 TaxID=2009329 RepID=UPI000C2D3090|nr:DinB family protein [Sagittula sp. P11]AUC54919.1 nuclease [Sagittula sp. P11]